MSNETKNNFCADGRYVSIQQAYKKEPGEDKRKSVSFTAPIQAVYDGKTGASLEAILAQFNSIYVQYQGSPKDTRNIIPEVMRRAGLTITYMDMESSTITERANSAVQKDNDHWGLDVNWSRVDELSLSGYISVSANGTWIINGEDTGIKAVGPKGDTGLTPWLKTIDNRLHFSYDNVTWEPCSENIAAWFRFSASSSDSQAGTIGRIQISRDNKTWTDLSPEFRNYLRIQGYVATTSALPANQAVGTIYGVGPTYATDDTAHTNPIYRLHVWNGTSWVDNGKFTSIAAGIVQETGDSETEVMSQKAVTEKLSELGSFCVQYPRFKIHTTIDGITGIESKNTKRAASVYLRTDDYDTISYNSGFVNAQTIYYNAIGNPSVYKVGDVNSDGVTVIDKSYKYFRITIKNTSDTEFDTVTDTDVVFDFVSKSKLMYYIESDLPRFKIHTTIDGITGIESKNTKRAASVYLRTDDYDTISYNSGFVNAQTIYYNAIGSPSTYKVSDVNSDGVTVIDKSYKYFRITVKRTDDTEFYTIADNDVVFDFDKDSDKVLDVIASEKIGVVLDLPGYIKPDGTLTDDGSSHWVASDFIKLPKNAVIRGNLIGSNSGNVVLVSYYDKYKKIIRELNVAVERINKPIYVADLKAKYVRFSGAAEDYREYQHDITISSSALSIQNENVLPFDSIELVNGLIDLDGGEVFNSDSNWCRTGYLPTEGLKLIEYKIKTTASEKLCVAFYDSNYNFLDGIPMSGNTTISGVVKGNEIHESAVYFRCSFKEAEYGNYTPILNIVYYDNTTGNKEVSDKMIFPKNIYLVCNDSENSAYSRNTSPAIYLDHMFKGLKKEHNIKFSNGGVIKTFDYRASSDSNWNPTLNTGLTVDDFTESIKIQGDIEDTEFDVNVHSVKSSAGKDKTVRCLVIGSSTVYGEGATYLSNGMKKVKPYHAICHEMFKKDSIEQNGGHQYITLGTIRHSELSFEFEGNKYTYDDFHEGRRGYSIAQFIENVVAFQSSDGSFSFLAWLDNYRTLTDSGERLYFGTNKETTGTAGFNIGYLEDGTMAVDDNGEPIYIGKKVTNTSIYNVCEPSHIVFHIGGNGGGTKEQYEELVGYAKSAFPNVYVALVMNDCMGTIFPSEYADSDSKCRWNMSDDRHEMYFGIQEVYESFDNDTYKEQRVYVLPFFFVSSPLFFSSRRSDLPEYSYSEEGKHLTPWGWNPTVHADIRAHANYAYQLYAWIKYTLAK